MTDVVRTDAFQSHEAAEPSSLAHTKGGAAEVAGSGRTDAVSSGIVKGRDIYEDANAAKEVHAGSSRRGDVLHSTDSPEAGTPGVEASDAASTAVAGIPVSKLAMQSAAHLKEAIADEAAEQADDSDELQGTAKMRRDGKSAVYAAQRIRAKSRKGGAVNGSTEDGAPLSPGGAKTGSKKTDLARASKSKKSSAAAKAKARMQSRRTWFKAREAQAGAQTAKAAAATAKKGAARTIAAAVSSAAAPLAGVLAGVVCFVLCVLIISQLVSALFGFWENEAMKSTGTLTGVEMEIAQSLKEYGFSNEGIAAILGNLKAESGMDPTSDEIMDGQFNYGYERACGIFQYTSTSPGSGEYWAFKSWCSANGKTWSTVDAQMEWTFSGNCEGTWSSRWSTGLAASGYYSNCPGYTDGSYYGASEFKEADDVEKATYSWMACYERPANGDYAHLDRRIEYAQAYYTALTTTGYAGSNTIVAAAYSQLGVPYVWGGSTPGVGLDCSGLTQYCYAQAGISIPHYSESQASGGTKIPLSQAQPGDILWKPGHVAIYIGGDEYIHEPQTGDVCKISTGISYFTCAVRY